MTVAMRYVTLCLCIFALCACSSVPKVPKVSMPKVSLPKLPSLGKEENTTTTPRELIGARLVNPKSDPDTPSMTVGKFIEYADRYLACDCATERFVKAWQRIEAGAYRLETNSAVIAPLTFTCVPNDRGRECYLKEIDRGADTTLAERFVPGSEIILFLYKNGVRCEREEPCPDQLATPSAPTDP
ncbi:MAG: hypothetical protein AAF384_12350 [Pseudomonadota bacterium]